MSWGEVLFAALFLPIVGGTLVLTVAIAARQLVFAVAALRMAQETVPPSSEPEPLPRAAVIVPAHNEEAVLGDALHALLASDYPADQLEIVVVDDRSTDRTGAIADAFAAAHRQVRVLHRPPGAEPGKSAALRDALGVTRAEVFVFFDADYVPSPGLIRQLVGPLSETSVGATMGRVAPLNAGANLLTRLIDLERRAGYTVDQFVRQRWRLVPQFGGTVGAVRGDALASAGGWRTGLLAEDTHLTYALYLAGYAVRYLDTAACYEEATETWSARYKQVRRWAYGHNQCLVDFLGPTLTARGRPPHQRLDAALVLTLYLYPLLAFASLPLALAAPAVLGASVGWTLLPVAALLTGFGNTAPFFQIVAAALRDRQPHVLAVLPLLPVSSAIGMVAAADGAAALIRDRLLQRRAVWDKTVRFRPCLATDQGPLAMAKDAVQ